MQQMLSNVGTHAIGTKHALPMIGVSLHIGIISAKMGFIAVCTKRSPTMLLLNVGLNVGSVSRRKTNSGDSWAMAHVAQMVAKKIMSTTMMWRILVRANMRAPQ